MVNQKEQVKEAVKQTEELAVKLEAGAPEQVIDPLTELLGRAQSAYAAYMEAEKEVARAYKARERQVERSYKEAEQQANSACEAATEQALRVREKAEQQAEETCKKAKEKAMDVYQENVGQA